MFDIVRAQGLQAMQLFGTKNFEDKMHNSETAVEGLACAWFHKSAIIFLMFR